MKHILVSHLTACAVLLIAAFAISARADEKTVEPSAGMPEDALLYIQVNNLASIVESATENGMFDIFRRTNIARNIGLDALVEEWSEVRLELEPELGVDLWAKMVDALGDRWGVAALEDGENEIDGLMFARSETDNSVEELLRALWAVDMRAGAIMRIEEQEFGRSRLINVIRDEDRSNWYALGPDIAISAYSRELLLRAINAIEGEAGNLRAENRFSRAIESFGGSDIFMWGDFGRLLEMDIVDLDFGEPMPPLITMLREGAVSDGAVGANLVEGGLEADFLLRLSAERMSPPLLAIAGTPVSGTSGVWNMIHPDDIAVHISSRHKISQRIDVVKWNMDQDQRRDFERTLANLATILGGMRANDFLNSLGPETSLVVLKPSPDSDGLADALFFLQLAPDQDFRRRLGNSLNTVFSILTTLTLRHAQQAGQPIRVELKQNTHQGVRFGSLAISGGGLPGNLQPCYGIVGDYLVLASTSRAMTSLIDSMRRNAGAAPVVPRMLRLTRNHADLFYVDVEPALESFEQTMVYLAPSLGLDNYDNNVTLEDFVLVISMLREALAPFQKVVAHTSYTTQTAGMKLRAQVDWKEWESYQAVEKDHAPVVSEHVAAKE